MCPADGDTGTLMRKHELSEIVQILCSGWPDSIPCNQRKLFNTPISDMSDGNSSVVRDNY